MVHVFAVATHVSLLLCTALKPTFYFFVVTTEHAYFATQLSASSFQLPAMFQLPAIISYMYQSWRRGVGKTVNQ